MLQSGFLLGFLYFHPDEADTLFNIREGLARVYLARGEKEKAKEQISQALFLRPDVPALNFKLARILMGEGKLPEARERLRRALGKEPALVEKALADPAFRPLVREPWFKEVRSEE